MLTPSLPPDIHLWVANHAAISDPDLLASYRDLLSTGEKQQESRFHFAQHRHRYLVTRALVRTVLSRYASVAPPDWRFAINDHGRPEAANTEAQEIALNFNLSHSKDLIALAVTKRRAIGIDIEHLRPRAAALNIADRYFTKEEANRLRDSSPELQSSRFHEYWTLKESYVKARGVGLSIPPQKFGFHFASNGQVGLSLDADLRTDLKEQADRWQFWQLQLNSEYANAEYVIAVCAERSA